MMNYKDKLHFVRMQFTKVYEAELSCNQVVIGSAMYVSAQDQFVLSTT